MNLLTTFAGSLMEGFLPRGWDLAKIDACGSNPPGAVGARQGGWHRAFEPIPCASVEDFDVVLGHEIARAIRRARGEGRQSALILPVGPMGMQIERVGPPSPAEEERRRGPARGRFLKRPTDVQHRSGRRKGGRAGTAFMFRTGGPGSGDVSSLDLLGEGSRRTTPGTPAGEIPKFAAMPGSGLIGVG